MLLLKVHVRKIISGRTSVKTQKATHKKDNTLIEKQLCFLLYLVHKTYFAIYLSSSFPLLFNKRYIAAWKRFVILQCTSRLPRNAIKLFLPYTVRWNLIMRDNYFIWLWVIVDVSWQRLRPALLTFYCNTFGQITISSL